jgi:hypothetical protein|tara:strand:+ start:1173 stop:1394 length:222 start_codon:yes stop_codon:yes gene_type:complete
MKYLINFKFKEGFSDIIDAENKDEAIREAKERLLARIDNDVAVICDGGAFGIKHQVLKEVGFQEKEYKERKFT